MITEDEHFTDFGSEQVTAFGRLVEIAKGSFLGNQFAECGFG
ncbi:hypothetical protein ACQE3D_00125 [Methylomonas sp. MS20]